MLCHSVRSCLPVSVFQTSLVANGNLHIARPLGVKRTSGSLPRLPTSKTLLTEAIVESSCCLLGTNTSCALCRGTSRSASDAQVIVRQGESADRTVWQWDRHPGVRCLQERH